MNKQLKVAVVQAKANTLDHEGNVAYGLELVKKSKEMGADLVLFPECFINAYEMPNIFEDKSDNEIWEMSTCPISQEQLRNNSTYQQWTKKALVLDSPYIQEFCQLAGTLKIGIVITCYTKGKEKPRNSAIVIDKQGKIIMQYDKVHTCDFSLESLLESGEKFKVCDFDGVKIGLMICYDREYPESARMLMLKGAEIILVPNNCSCMEPRVHALCTRAYENMTGVVMANVPGMNMGKSCAFSPIPWDDQGLPKEMTIFMADATSEEVYMAEFDLEELRRYRESEMMGNTFRKVKAYSQLLSDEVSKPFIRSKWIED